MWKVAVSKVIFPSASGVLCRRFIVSEHSSIHGTLSRRNYSVSKIKLTHKTSVNESQTAAKYKYQKSKSTDDSGVPFGGWFLLIIPVSTLGLGIWQVFRWRWKLGLIEEMHLKSIADPVPLPLDLTDLDALDYRKVKVRGEFDYSNEVLIGPRSLLEHHEHERSNRGVFSSSSSNNGFLIITPFKLEGTDESILVNRGWIGSKNAKNLNLKKYKHVEGPVDLVGIVRKTEQRQPFMSKTRPGQSVLHYRDVPLMSEMLGTEHVFLDLYSIEGVDFSNARQESIPVPRQTRVSLRNEHVSYFITWFSLSAITSFMWHRQYIRKLPLL